MIKIRYRLTHPNARVPTKGTQGAAGWDLYLPRLVQVGPVPILIDLEFRMEIPEGWEATIRPRSGLCKQGIFLSNSPGTIDSDYRGNIHVPLHAETYIRLERGERVVQMLFNRVPKVTWIQVSDELTSTDRGTGGFGSTGK